MKQKHNESWPVLRSYEGHQLSRVKLPVGGIGTGTVSISGRGGLVDWEIMNRPAKLFAPPLVTYSGAPFFCLRAENKQGVYQKMLEGPLYDYEFEGGCGSPNRLSGLPRFDNCRFDAAYPFGQVHLSDKNFPLAVRLQTFNPLIPGDAENSGLPVVVLRYTLENKTAQPVKATIAGSLTNYIGSPYLGSAEYFHSQPGSKPNPDFKNKNTFKQNRGLKGVFLEPGIKDNKHHAWGTIALTTTSAVSVSYRTSWKYRPRTEPIMDFWEDLQKNGKLKNIAAHKDETNPVATLAASITVPARSQKTVTFLLTWVFPNREPWNNSDPEKNVKPEQRMLTNYYATKFKDAWDVAATLAPKLSCLEKKTIEFVHSFLNTDIPDSIKEAALFNLSTLRTETCFRTADGRFWGWEGINDSTGSCYGNCTHVWNYELATAFLFGDLSRTMRDTEFTKMTDQNGLMSFRCSLPLGSKRYGAAAADGQMGCIMKLYRDWQLCGDDNLLTALWDQAKNALSFCWVKGGWDADQDGVMEGCQHNTMDVEYYGPNPQMQLWYLGALRAAEEMARYLGDDDFAEKVRTLFEQGSAWTDKNLFNGEYYEHIISTDRNDIYKGLNPGFWSPNQKDPDPSHLQLGAGCLIDQLVGQYMSSVCGLGYLVKPANIKKTLKSILKYNRQKGFKNFFNNMRRYALDDETALTMASYPHGNRPPFPFPYFTEVMTGFEYVVGVGCLYESLNKDGLEVFADIRARYDGTRRSPFDEAECGHHYARAMASWGGVIAWTGFQYSGVTNTMTIADRDGRFFWSNGDAYGTYCKRGRKFTLQVLGGAIRIQTLHVAGSAAVTINKTIQSGKTISCSL